MPVADWKICGVLSSPTPCDCAPRWGARSIFRADLTCRLALLSRRGWAHDGGREQEEAACNSTPSMPINTLPVRYSLR